MAERETQHPEGTDKAIVAASETAAAETGERGFIASGAAREQADKLVGQVRDQVATLRGQAGEKLRAYADDGKGKGANLLDELSGIIEDAAKSIEERLGADYGDYAHKAAGAVSNFAGKVREKDVGDFVEDAKSAVKKSPVIAIAAAAVVGFALVRVLRTGVDDVRGRAPANDGD